MSKKNKLRCWVCGIVATRSMGSEDHICDNPVCEQATLHMMRLTVAETFEQEQQEEKKYKEGAQP